MDAIRQIEKRGAIVLARRLMQASEQVFRYAIASGLATRDPSQDIRGALRSAGSKKHRTALAGNQSFQGPANAGNLFYVRMPGDGNALNPVQPVSATVGMRLRPLLAARQGQHHACVISHRVKNGRRHPDSVSITLLKNEGLCSRRRYGLPALCAFARHSA